MRINTNQELLLCADARKERSNIPSRVFYGETLKAVCDVCDSVKCNADSIIVQVHTASQHTIYGTRSK